MLLVDWDLIRLDSGNTVTQLRAACPSAVVVVRLAPICVAQSDAKGQAAVKIAELKALSSSSKRTTYLTEQGWATMPGETAPGKRVAAACANQLVVIGE